MIDPARRLTPDEHARFERDGYLAPMAGLSPDEAGDCARQLAAALAATGGRADTATRNNPHLLFRWAADLIRDARVLEPISSLLGPNLLVLRTTLFVKPPRDPSTVAWHQDVAYWDLSSDRTVTAWVALTDSSAANGCVQVVPGSHRGPLLAHHLGRDRNNRLVRGQVVELDQVAASRVVDLELRAGQFSMHDGRLLHSSPANPSGGLRAGIAIRFVPPDVWQRRGPRMSAALVRGEDAYRHYEHEALPRYDGDPAARVWHRRALRRYALHMLWQVARAPSIHHLRILGRLAPRRDALRAMLFR